MFQPESMIQGLVAGYEAGDFERYEVDAAMREHTVFMTDEELTNTQRAIHRQFSILTGIHESILAERIRRNPPNQMSSRPDV